MKIQIANLYANEKNKKKADRIKKALQGKTPLNLQVSAVNNCGNLIITVSSSLVENAAELTGMVMSLLVDLVDGE